MSTAAIMIFTSQPPDEIFKAGGSQSWRVNRQHASQCEYAILTQNTKQMGFAASRPIFSHGQAFLIGKISAVVPSTDSAGRFLIRFNSYAMLGDRKVRWPGYRGPFFYTTLEVQGVALAFLTFKPMPAI